MCTILLCVYIHVKILMKPNQMSYRRVQSLLEKEMNLQRVAQGPHFLQKIPHLVRVSTCSLRRLFEPQYNIFFSLFTHFSLSLYCSCSLWACFERFHMILSLAAFFFPFLFLHWIKYHHLTYQCFLTGAISRKRQEKLSKVHKETQYKEIVCTGNYWSGMLTASSNFGKLLYI